MHINISDETNYKYIVGVIAIIIALTVNWEAFKSVSVGKLLDNLATPNSGEAETLPKEVQFILEFSRMNHVKSIHMSPAIANNRFIAQPLTESVYPIIIKDSANIFVSVSAETMPINCAALKIEKGIRIANCR